VTVFFYIYVAKKNKGGDYVTFTVCASVCELQSCGRTDMDEIICDKLTTF